MSSTTAAMPSSTAIVANTSSYDDNTMSAGPIVGGVIGGVALLGGLALLFFFLRRRRYRKNLELNVPANERSPRAQRAPTWKSPEAVERARRAEGRLAVPANPNARMSVQSLDLPPLAYEEAGNGNMLPKTPESAYIAARRMEDGTMADAPGSRDERTTVSSTADWKAREAGVERSESGYGTQRSMTGSSEKGWQT